MLKYPSIENHFNISKSRKIMAWINRLFYATEKIHGANMQIQLDNSGFAYFSRNRQLDNTDPFYNRLLNSSNTKTILEIAEKYFNDNNLDELHIFGELYGAGIQNMQYKENLDNVQQFRVFDVFITENGHMRTLSQSELYDLFDETLRVPDVNITKSLAELIKDELDNNSRLGGETEGLVYKPVESQELDLQDGSITNYVAVKHKTERFAEIKSKPKVKTEMAIEDVDFVNNISRYFTMSRLEGLLGKLAIEPSMQNLSKIIPAYLEDVKNDYIKTEEPKYFNDKLLGKQANQVVKLVKELLMNS